MFGAEYLMVRPDGTQAHLRANAAPIREEDGTVSGAILTFLDITDRARTDLALRLLADLSEPLAAVGDLRRDLPAAARLLCPAFADRCGVALRTADGGRRRVARGDPRGPRRRPRDGLDELVRQVVQTGVEVFRTGGLEPLRAAPAPAPTARTARGRPAPGP